MSDRDFKRGKRDALENIYNPPSRSVPSDRKRNEIRREDYDHGYDHGKKHRDEQMRRK